jgi:hypothetical protein
VPGNGLITFMKSRRLLGSFSARRMKERAASSSWKFTPLALASATGRPRTVANAKTGPWTERIVRWVIRVGGLGSIGETGVVTVWSRIVNGRHWPL